MPKFDYVINSIDGTISLRPDVSNASSTYEWSINGDVFSVEEQPEIPLAAASENVVELNVSNKNGCSNKTTRTVVMQDGMDIPSAFSPNGDGVNDYFRVEFEEELISFNVQIFDRLGATIVRIKRPIFWMGWFKQKRNRTSCNLRIRN